MLWLVDLAVSFCINGALLVGAINLLRHGVTRLLVIGFWARIIVVPVGMAVALMVWPYTRTTALIFLNVVLAAQAILFPLLVIFSLRCLSDEMNLERPLVVPIDVFDGVAGGPWQRLMRLVARMTIVFAIVQLADAGNDIHWVLQPLPAGTNGPYLIYLQMLRVRLTLFTIARAVIDVGLLAGAFYFLKRGRGHWVMAMMMRLLLVVLIAGWAGDVIFGIQQWMDRIANVLHEAMNAAAVVVLMLVILREYSRQLEG